MIGGERIYNASIIPPQHFPGLSSIPRMLDSRPCSGQGQARAGMAGGRIPVHDNGRSFDASDILR